MKKKHLMSSFVIFMFIVFLTPAIASAKIKDSSVHDTAIITAYYCDSDGDGDQDDIEVYFSIIFNDNDDTASIDDDDDYELEVEHDYSVFIALQLPSGITYSYLFEEEIKASSVTYKLFFIDHATELGDYILDITVVEKTKKPDSTETSHDSLVFDPPGGKPGVEPRFEYVKLE